MTSNLKRYRVAVTTWTAYQIDLDAADGEATVALAEEMYSDGSDSFSHRDGGITDIDTEEMEQRP